MPTPEELTREKIDQLLTAAACGIPQAIVAEVERRLSVTDELETLATRLRQSIIQQAFSGHSSHE